MNPSTASAQPAPSAADRAWTPGWSTAPQPASAGFTPNWAEEGFDGHTLRQVVRTTAGGGAVRIRLSNAYGDRPLEVRGASVAPAAGGSAVHGGRARRAAFSGSGTVLVPVGGEAVSDPVPLPVAAFDRVAVTLHLGPETGPATFHAQGYAASHRAAGDRLGDTDGSAFTETTHSWYYLTGLDVHGPAPERGAVAAIGDSITDGFGSVPDTDTRYPDALAELLAERGEPRAVLNAGIGGNRLLNDSAWYGERSPARLERDVLRRPGVGALVVLQGITDIGFPDWAGEPTAVPAPPVDAGVLIAAHRALAERARAAGLRTVGATLPPYRGSQFWSEHGERTRAEVNAWIRGSGRYDAVADADAALADPGDPLRLRPPFDSGDRLHPNPDGFRALAATVADALKEAEAAPHRP